MKLSDQKNTEPLWREEVSIHTADEKYVSRRQLAKFLVLTSLGMFVGQLWILVKSWFTKAPVYPVRPVARLDEIPVGGVRLFQYPGPNDPCILVRPSETETVAYSQKCTHLSCAVYYSQEKDRIECPCHEGYFSVRTGRVLQGPPQRPLPRVVLEQRGDHLVAVAMDLQAGEEVRHA
jgi:Rieske Fe-S protein